MRETLSSNQIVEWLRRLIYLDARVFEDVRTNPAATIPGLAFVTVATFISGIGGFLWWETQGFGSPAFGSGRDILVHSTIVGSLIAVVLWGLWLLIVYVMLVYVFRERAYIEQLLRVMGLAATPLAISGLMFIPEISLAIGLASVALTFALTGVAIQYVTTAGPLRVLAANICGFLVWAGVLTLLASSGSSNLQPNAPGVFLFGATASIADELSFGRE